jgi:hypothetical protein
MMIKKILIGSIIIGSLSGLNATTLEEEVALEQKETTFEDKFILSQILSKKAVKVGEETLVSLRNNLEFIEKLDKDPDFVKCVVLSKNIKKMDKLSVGAKSLLDRGKISKEDYLDYINDLNDEKSKLSQQVEEKSCKDK